MHPDCDSIWQTNIYLFKTAKSNSKWPPQKLIKPSPNIIVTWKVTVHVYLYWFFVRLFKLIILCRLFGTLLLPEFLSNQHGIWTPYPQSSWEVCYDFISQPACSSGIIQDFLDHYILEFQKGSFCLLVKWADTAFWLAQQYAYNRVQCLYNGLHGGWFSSHCLTENRRVNRVPRCPDLLHTLVSRFDNKNYTLIQCFNSGPASQTVAQYWNIIVYLVWTDETFQMLQLKWQLQFFSTKRWINVVLMLG